MREAGSAPCRGDDGSSGLVPQPRASSRDHLIGVHRPLCHSEYFRTWRDPADWLSWWRRCHSLTRRRSIIQPYFVPDVFGRAALGWSLLARTPPPRAPPAAQSESLMRASFFVYPLHDRLVFPARAPVLALSLPHRVGEGGDILFSTF